MSKRTALAPIEYESPATQTPALRVEDLVFVSAQGPVDPVTGEVVGKTIQEQTEQVMRNLADVLNPGRCTLNDCVRLTVYLRDLADREAFDAVYPSFFRLPRPARTVVGATPEAGRLAVDAIAIRGSGS